MEYKSGDIVVVPYDGHLRYAKILGVDPILVSIDHGNGGFHYLQEEDIKPVDQVNPESIYTLDNKVPSWNYR